MERRGGGIFERAKAQIIPAPPHLARSLLQVTQRLRPGPPSPLLLPASLRCQPLSLDAPPPGPSFSRVGSLAAIRRPINKWARETLSGRELPRAGARGGYWLGPDLCGHSRHAARGWEFVFPSPLLIGQQREYSRRKLTRMGTGRLGRKLTPRRGKVTVGYSDARFYFCLPLAFKHCFM